MSPAGYEPAAAAARAAPSLDWPRRCRAVAERAGAPAAAVRAL